MDILWIIPTIGYKEKEVKEYLQFLQQNAFDGTTITLVEVKHGCSSIECRLDEAYATLPILQEALEGEKQGFHSCVIGCAGDAGVSVVKEALSIPVVGPGEAAALIARLIGERIAVLTTLPERVPSVRNKFKRLIPADQLFVYPLKTSVLELRKDAEKSITTISNAVMHAIKSDQVDTAILACLSMRGMAAKVQQKTGINVIDPAIAALGFAQLLPKMDLAQSRITYPYPPEKQRTTH